MLRGVYSTGNRTRINAVSRGRLQFTLAPKTNPSQRYLVDFYIYNPRNLQAGGSRNDMQIPDTGVSLPVAHIRCGLSGPCDLGPIDTPGYWLNNFPVP